jgi:DNA-binding beta-propeller fold protein YncE
VIGCAWSHRGVGRLRKCVPIGIFVLLPAVCAGCGGGSGSANGSANVQPPPAPSDFSITLSSSSLSLSQGATSAPITVSVAGQNGFTGAVQVTLAGFPSGVLSNPASPFNIAAGANTAIVLGAAPNASTGSFTVTALGNSGSLSHSATLALAVQPAIGAPLPRTSYARTDAVAALDDPPSEARHRRIAYDAANKRIFIANRAMNRVEVFSTSDQTRLQPIPVPGASSADLSLDGSTLWIGTTTQQAIAIDTAALKVKSRYSIPPLSPIPNTVFDRPEELLPMSSGKIMMRLRQSAAAQSLLAIWDPATNILTNLTSAVPALFQNGLGAMARTGDHTKIIVAANDASGESAIFDANGSLLAGPHAFGAGTIPLVAANPDGSRFAVQFVSAGAAQLFLLDAALNQVSTPVALSAQGLAFSRDGNFFYASESAAGLPLVSVFDGRTLQPLGQVPDPSIQGVHSEIEEADETQVLFAIANRGVSFIDAAHPGALPSSAPSFASAPAAQPSQGPFTGGTATFLPGQNFESSAQIKFGWQLATAATVTPAQIQVTAPPSVTNGPVNITAFFPSGWLAIAPDVFSYGPQILEVLPNAGSKAGGDAIQIYGYGFGSDAAQITVKIGAAAATVQKVETVTSLATSLALDVTYPFPLQRITLLTPPAAPGQADITVTSTAGTTTSARAFQYTQSAQVFAKAALYKFILYDQKRQWLYLSATDHVDVFDLAAAQFHATGIAPPGGPPPTAALRGLSLTPDASQLVVADFGAQSVYLLSPDAATGTKVSVGGVAGFVNSGPARVAATSTQTVFVAMSGEGGSSGSCSSCLSQLNLSATPPTVQPAPQPEVTSLAHRNPRQPRAGANPQSCFGPRSRDASHRRAALSAISNRPSPSRASRHWHPGRRRHRRCPHWSFAPPPILARAVSRLVHRSRRAPRQLSRYRRKRPTNLRPHHLWPHHHPARRCPALHRHNFPCIRSRLRRYNSNHPRQRLPIRRHRSHQRKIRRHNLQGHEYTDSDDSAADRRPAANLNHQSRRQLLRSRRRLHRLLAAKAMTARLRRTGDSKPRTDLGSFLLLSPLQYASKMVFRPLAPPPIRSRRQSP